MTTWIYKATTTKLPYRETADLALHHNFLCRSLYTRVRFRAARVSRVLLGDTIYFYYRENNALRTISAIGTFEVVNGAALFPRRFSGPIARTALMAVTNSPSTTSLLALLQTKAAVGVGYAVDPVLGVLTGWCLKNLNMAPPTFQQSWMPNPMTTLWPY